MRFLLVSVGLACLTASSAHGQTRVVSGRVVDDSTGAPLAGASVSQDGRVVATGDDGEFRLCGVAPGRAVARVVASGYAEDSAVARVRNRDTTLLLRLRRASQRGAWLSVPGPSGTNPYNNAVMILDGERVLLDPTRCWAPRAGERRIDGLRREEIESLYLVKPAEAIARFGPDARNGALLITSRAAARARPE